MWRTKDIRTGYISDWDGTWTHFGAEPREWDKIDQLQIRLTPENKECVMKSLKQIYVPGTKKILRLTPKDLLDSEP